MLQTGDIAGRLRLFRYGLVVIVVVTFLVSLLAPYVVVSGWAGGFNELAAAVGQDRVDVGITTFLGQAIITTVIVAVLMAVVYFIYRQYLARSVRPGA
jgi:hypothetical protein